MGKRNLSHPFLINRIAKFSQPKKGKIALLAGFLTLLFPFIIMTLISLLGISLRGDFPDFLAKAGFVYFFQLSWFLYSPVGALPFNFGDIGLLIFLLFYAYFLSCLFVYIWKKSAKIALFLGLIFLALPLIYPLLTRPTVDTNKEETMSMWQKSRSWGDVFFSETGRATVFLYAADEKISVNEYPYCGAPEAGMTILRGHYQLILDATTFMSDRLGETAPAGLVNSEIDVGDTEFVAGTSHDAKVIVEELDPKGYKNFIILATYGSCNSQIIRIYGYDLTISKLVQYKFRDKDGRVADELCFTFPLTKTAEGNLISRCYSQNTGKNEVGVWEFAKKNKEFKEIKHYQEST